MQLTMDCTICNVAVATIILSLVRVFIHIYIYENM